MKNEIDEYLATYKSYIRQIVRNNSIGVVYAFTIGQIDSLTKFMDKVGAYHRVIDIDDTYEIYFGKEVVE